MWADQTASLSPNALCVMQAWSIRQLLTTSQCGVYRSTACNTCSAKACSIFKSRSSWWREAADAEHARHRPVRGHVVEFACHNQNTHIIWGKPRWYLVVRRLFCIMCETENTTREFDTRTENHMDDVLPLCVGWQAPLTHDQGWKTESSYSPSWCMR